VPPQRRTAHALAIAGALLAAVLVWHDAVAAPIEDFLSTLSETERREFTAWRTAKTRHDRQLDAYWAEIEKKRAQRRAKRRQTKFFDADDYVWTVPPTYQGPRLSAALDKRWDRFLAQGKPAAAPAKPKKELPGVADFLAAAKEYYGFVPARISEKEFKRRYAQEALNLGLAKEQVIRVYALETGGNGTADMQAGINPITKKGRPISSALGYAQLLHANSIGELVKHGAGFVKRLQRMEANASDPARKRELQQKIAALQRMIQSAKSVPNDWYKHVAYAQTRKGYGIHAINLDGDIGPWLQSLKLKGLKDFAARSGVTNLSGEELEIMNLSGPATGLEMMAPTGLTAPTANFFTRRAYYVNKMVMGKTSAELLGEFTRRMDAGARKPGAVEFAEAFDEVTPSANLPWR